MKRSMVVCLLAAAGCGGQDPIDPPVVVGPGSLTGDWDGWCCSDILDTGWNWYLHLEEGGGGEITGNVTRLVSVGLLPGPPSVSAGTVAGKRNGGDVTLTFAYESGREEVLEGRRVSRDSLHLALDFSREGGPFTRSEVDLSPGFVSLPVTGRWWGGCCGDEFGDVPGGFGWRLDLVEGDDGGISGNVRLQVQQAESEPLESTGTVTGMRRGAEIALEFHYTGGDRADTRSQFFGRRVYPDGFRGTEDSHPGEVTWFSR